MPQLIDMNHKTPPTKIREAAVAGLFYPRETTALREMVSQYLARSPDISINLRAAIVPHAGYIYSGQIAASAYKALQSARNSFKTVALIGPAHRCPVRGLAVCDWEGFMTPLGCITVNQDVVRRAFELPFVQLSNQAHQEEHCLEVQLPFLQVIDDKLTIAPFLFGQTSEEEIALLLEEICEDDSILPIVSSDLSHYLSYQEAIKRDQSTSQAIETLDSDAISADSACGAMAIKGLLTYAKRNKLAAKKIFLSNSGDSTGVHDEVVGYGAYIFE